MYLASHEKVSLYFTDYHNDLIRNMPRRGKIRQKICFKSVWPDWAIFESSWWQIWFQKKPNYLVTFLAILKTFLLIKINIANFCATRFGQIWLLFIPTSGHAVSNPKGLSLNSCSTFNRLPTWRSSTTALTRSRLRRRLKFLAKRRRTTTSSRQSCAIRLTMKMTEMRKL